MSEPHPVTSAVEVRLYAEDPANNFFPVTGRLLYWKPFEVLILKAAIVQNNF